jgi:hypothetical protein
MGTPGTFSVALGVIVDVKGDGRGFVSRMSVAGVFLDLQTDKLYNSHCSAFSNGFTVASYL